MTEHFFKISASESIFFSPEYVVQHELELQIERIKKLLQVQSFGFCSDDFSTHSTREQRIIPKLSKSIPDSLKLEEQGHKLIVLIIAYESNCPPCIFPQGVTHTKGSFLPTTTRVGLKTGNLHN
jgi:hypothetical protein